MKTNIVSWGNSKALRIPKVYIDVLDWKVNDKLNKVLFWQSCD